MNFKAENNKEVKVLTLVEIYLAHCLRVFAYREKLASSYANIEEGKFFPMEKKDNFCELVITTPGFSKTFGSDQMVKYTYYVSDCNVSDTATAEHERPDNPPG